MGGDLCAAMKLNYRVIGASGSDLSTARDTGRAAQAIMAAGVYNKAISPNKPWRFNMPYNIRPMTTVGSAIKVFRLIINSFLPPNSFKATIIPSGIPIKEAIKTAVNETFKEVITMLKSAASISKILIIGRLCRCPIS